MTERYKQAKEIRQEIRYPVKNRSSKNKRMILFLGEETAAAIATPDRYLVMTFTA